MILYFSGTGNSKYVAQRMAEALNQSLLSMNDRIRSHDTSPVETDERLVIVTPTYAWRIPRLVRDWLLETEFPGAAQVWFIMTCGSEIGHASRYNRSLCQTKGLTDMGTAQIIMPENYIAMFDAPQAEEARRIVAKAQPDIDRSIAAVREGRPFPPPHDRLYDRFMSGPVNPIFYACFVKSSVFTVSEACTGCGQCRPPLSHQQHHPPGRQARLGQRLHPLHGLYLLLPHVRHRVRKKEPRQAPVSLRGPVSPPVRRWPPATFPQRQISGTTPDSSGRSPG